MSGTKRPKTKKQRLDGTLPDTSPSCRWANKARGEITDVSTSAFRRQGGSCPLSRYWGQLARIAGFWISLSCHIDAN